MAYKMLCGILHHAHGYINSMSIIYKKKKSIFHIKKELSWSLRH